MRSEIPETRVREQYPLIFRNNCSLTRVLHPSVDERSDIPRLVEPLRKEGQQVDQGRYPKCHPKLWHITVSFCLIGMAAKTSWAECSAKNQDTKKAHVEFVLASLPALRFFSDSDRTGRPIIQLNDRGLYVGDSLVCEWPNGSFSRTTEPNRVLGFDGREFSKPCPNNVPVKSGFGDMGLGTAVLCVEVEMIDNDIAELQYDNRRLSLDLQGIPKDSWRYQPPRIRQY